jgi:hypothetical protein
MIQSLYGHTNKGNKKKDILNKYTHEHSHLISKLDFSLKCTYSGVYKVLFSFSFVHYLYVYFFSTVPCFASIVGII